MKKDAQVSRPEFDSLNATYWRLPDRRMHRFDGPAYETKDGSKEWWLNGHLHREDGPACEYPNGTKYWYINGKMLTYQQFCDRYLVIHLVEYKHD